MKIKRITKKKIKQGKIYTYFLILTRKLHKRVVIKNIRKNNSYTYIYIYIICISINLKIEKKKN